MVKEEAVEDRLAAAPATAGCSGTSARCYFNAIPCGLAGPVANAVSKSGLKRESSVSDFDRTFAT